MTELESLYNRHAVRRYKDIEIPQDVCKALEDEIKKCNLSSGLNIQLIKNEEKAFNSFIAKYGSFRNVKNYIALVGDKKDEKLDELCGYYGEKLVLLCQSLGLNTCWVYLSYKAPKGVIEIPRGDKLVIVIALGYGETQGNARPSKKFEDVVVGDNEKPGWFIDGVKAALLAPTAINQQKFTIELVGENKVLIKKKPGICTGIDLGIVKYNFLVGAKKENFEFI
jgi:nitroreductase